MQPMKRFLAPAMMVLVALALDPLVSMAAKPVSEADSTFLQKAAQANAAEVQVSQAAETRSKNERITAFADRMIKDHSEANRKLDALAKQKNVATKTVPDPDHMMKIGKLEKLEGAEFERAYAALMVEDHRAAVQLFEQAANESQDSDIKQFAQSTLPTLQEHAKMAEALPH